jgi:hypothetical protein
MLFKGAFTNMVDFQARMREFESDIAAAENLEKVWQIVQAAGRKCGFHGTRLQMLGRTYVEIEDGYQSSIQLRIPLNGDGYVNFYGADGQMSVVVLNTFLPAVSKSLNLKLAELNPAIVPFKAASEMGTGSKPKLVRKPA